MQTTMNALLTNLRELGTVRQADARQLLLRAGDVAQHLYQIEQGCVRLYVVDSEGRETSTQFFFEGEVVSSMESFLTGRPSALYLVTMEACRLRMVQGSAIRARAKADPALRADIVHSQVRQGAHPNSRLASSTKKCGEWSGAAFSASCPGSVAPMKTCSPGTCGAKKRRNPRRRSSSGRPRMRIGDVPHRRGHLRRQRRALTVGA